MVHIPKELDDTFSHSVQIKENCTAKKFIGDGSSLINLPASTETDPIFIAASAAYNAEIGASNAIVAHSGDTTIHFTSTALWSSLADVQDVAYTASNALTNHSADSSDPHGATLTQTTLNVGTASITSDNDAASTAVVRNIVIDTSSAAHTASNYTQGTLLLIYA